MTDSRTTATPRTCTLTLRLSQFELEDLESLAHAHCRRPGDELRFLLQEALMIARNQKFLPSGGA